MRFTNRHIDIAINNYNGFYLFQRPMIKANTSDTNRACTLIFIPLCTNTDGLLQFWLTTAFTKVSGNKVPEVRLEYWTFRLESHESRLMFFLYNENSASRKLAWVVISPFLAELCIFQINPSGVPTESCWECIFGTIKIDGGILFNSSSIILLISEIISRNI